MVYRSEFGLNPFTPEVGRIPPYLAGRDGDLDWWGEVLANGIAKGIGCFGLMYGPRGMGKTAILDRFSIIAAAVGCDVVEADSSMLDEGLSGLADRLLAEVTKAGFQQESRETGEGAAVKIGGTGGQLEQRRTETYSDPLASHGSVSARLKSQAKETPLALLIDEVHAAQDYKAVKALVNAGQQIAKKSPCFMMLAGTPGLPQTLKDAGCTFTERATEIGVGLLDSSASKDAIRTPLANSIWRLQSDSRLTISDDAIDAVVQDSQGYPYFLQLWGHSLWEHGAAQNKDALTADDTAIIQQEIERARHAFYERRGGELISDAETLTAAKAVASAFDRYTSNQDEDLLKRVALFDDVADSLAAAYQSHRARDLAADKALDALIKAGFVWLPPDKAHFVPGIPSYMNYAKNAFKERTRRHGGQLLTPQTNTEYTG